MAKQVNASQKKEILHLFVEGTNIKEIAKIFNFSIPTITRQLKTLLGSEEFYKIKSDLDNKKETKDLTKNNESKDLSLDNVNINQGFHGKTKEVTNKNDFYIENMSTNNLFVELTPVACDIDSSSQKDLSSVDIANVEFPKIVYMIVDKKIELEIKLLKEYPEWQFLSKEDLDRKTIRIYLDIKTAKRDCSKEKKVIKVPNTNVFKIVAPLLNARGISRIVSDDQLIAI